MFACIAVDGNNGRNGAERLYGQGDYLGITIDID